jgi:hypothetical protein
MMICLRPNFFLLALSVSINKTEYKYPLSINTHIITDIKVV